MKRHLPLVAAALLAIALVAGACGDDDGDTTATDTVASTDTTTAADDGDASSGDSSSGDSSGGDTSSAGGSSHHEMSAEELEVWQTDLNAVGCWAGPVDGSLGPQTQAAITAFQAATGLAVDGRLGPQTEGALQEAVAAGETVCTTTTGGEAPTSAELVVTLNSPSYGKSFTIGTCSLDADLANAYVTGQADGMTFELEAVEGTGTLGVSGGTESDGITLNGEVSAMAIDPSRSFTATGTFGEPNLAGEAFTVTGACPDDGE